MFGLATAPDTRPDHLPRRRPHEVVEFMSDLFGRFDALSDKRGIWKAWRLLDCWAEASWGVEFEHVCGVAGLDWRGGSQTSWPQVKSYVFKSPGPVGHRLSSGPCGRNLAAIGPRRRFTTLGQVASSMAGGSLKPQPMSLPALLGPLCTQRRQLRSAHVIDVTPSSVWCTSSAGVGFVQMPADSATC